MLLQRRLAAICYLFLFFFSGVLSLSAQDKKSAPGEEVWVSFEEKKTAKKDEKKPQALTKLAEPVTKLAQPVAPKQPELTVKKGIVAQEEFLFPQEAASAKTAAKSPPAAESAGQAAGGQQPTTITGLPAAGTAPAPTPDKAAEEADRGNTPDINIEVKDNPWIPNFVEEFFARANEKQVLVAYKVAPSLVPTIDGESSEDAWLQSPVLEVPIEKGPIVKVQAIYDEENIYFLLRWDDDAANHEKNLWRFDGEKWLKAGEEDRLGLMWNIDNSILDFDLHACGIVCHDTDKDKQLHKMYTNADVEFADLWDWGAATSNPLGYAEDCYLDNRKFEAKTGQRDSLSAFIGLSVNVAKGGIHYDKADKPASEENNNAENSLPVYMIDPRKGGDPLVMTQDNFLPISDYSVFKKGNVVPGYLLRQLIGSRGDVSAKGNYNNGIWTLELKRKLETGNSDDVQFDIYRSYYFGIATFNNVRQDNHKKSSKCLLKFRVKQVYSPVIFVCVFTVLVIYLISLKKHQWEENRSIEKAAAGKPPLAASGQRDSDNGDSFYIYRDYVEKKLSPAAKSSPDEKTSPEEQDE